MVNSISWHRTWLFCVLISRRYTWADLMRKFNGVCWWKCNCPNAHPSVTRLKIYIFAYCLRPNPQKPSYPYLFFFSLSMSSWPYWYVGQWLTHTHHRSWLSSPRESSFFLSHFWRAFSLSYCAVFTDGFDTFTNNSKCCSWYWVPVIDACKPCCQVNPCWASTTGSFVGNPWRAALSFHLSFLCLLSLHKTRVRLVFLFFDWFLYATLIWSAVWHCSHNK